MTTQDIIDYYINLLILQYAGKSKARATVEAIVDPAVMDQLPIELQNCFDLETAEGVQLDIIGKYAGVSRNGYTFTAPITLDDTDFRKIIKLAITQNSAGSSLADIQNLLSIFFSGTLFIVDHKNMVIDYFFDSNEGSVELVEFFIKQGSLPRPMGVRIGSVIFVPDLTHFFGFRTYKTPAHNVVPFNTYSDFRTDWLFLSYADGVQI